MTSSAGSVGPVPFVIEGLTDAVKVGQGSFGVVYKAYQSAYDRMVAVKVLNMSLVDSVDRRRFDRECQALGALSNHPNIVTLHTAGVTSAGRPYLIMGYLPGGSLAERGILDWPDATNITVKIARALAAAHAEGILHRDIKPENILISSYGEPQLADFGVARIGEGSTINTSTGTAAIAGTLAHAAPEIVSGLAATEVTDVWSLASTLSALLSGQPPFYRPGENSPLPLMRRILNEAPADLRPLGVPNQLCAVIEAALAKDSWERTQSATAFAVALEEIQSQQYVAPSAMAGSVIAETSQPSGTGFDEASATRRRDNYRSSAAVPSAPSPVTYQPAPSGPAPSAGPIERPAPAVGDDDELRTRLRSTSPSNDEALDRTPQAPLATPDSGPSGSDSRPKSRNDRRVALGAAAALVIVILAVVAVVGSSHHSKKPNPHPPPTAPPAATVPDLSGQPVQAATSTLQGRGLKVQTASQPSPTAPAGQVIGQTPPAGTSQTKGMTISLVVSSGPIPPGSAEVPNAVGKVLSLDQSQLQAAGFTVTTTDQPNTRLPKGSVISQQPPAGSVAVKGSTIALMVSTAQGFLKNTPDCEAWVATSWNPSGTTFSAYRSYGPQAEVNYQRFEQVASPAVRPVVDDMVAQLKSFLAALSSPAEQDQAFQNFKSGSFFTDFTSVLQTMTFACWEPAS